ncbi:hypothetical protein IYY11_05415 [Methylocystis sp. H62]|jgi:hypothetical protein|uniref:hypothetical protein n=1 Tax=Methylocystis sp. H62 TaxID=2785789 RepID=UPI0018C22ADA|nr:hypothetical protein [Methylocystis sp. H62]MBG0792843.1 hypothetical protein [Methylocystis sp. H62]
MKRQFKIRVSRIETIPATDGDFAQVTFRIHNGSGSFGFPVLVKKNEYDEADITKVARSILHENLAELTSQTEKWKLTEDELAQLSSWKFYQGA